MGARGLVFFGVVFLLCCSPLCYCQNYQVAIGDVNGDGKPDVVVANPTLNNIAVFLNTGGGTLGPGAFLAVPGGVNSVSLADINGDGHLDIIVTGLQVMLGDGAGNFAAPVNIPIGGLTPLSNPVVADFNGDGHLDIAFGTGTAQVAIIFGDGHGGFSASRLIPVANDGTGADELILLDANKDGKPDLVLNTAKVTGGILHEAFLLLNDGTANFSVSLLSRAGFTGDLAGFVTAVADFDNDGFADFLFALGSDNFIMFGDGHGGALSTTPVNSLLVLPQGFDVDGNQTINLVSPGGSYFPGNGHGGFGDPISLAIPQGAGVIAVADMNGDGKPDFILQSGTNVSVVLNSLTAPASFSSSTAFLMSSSASTTSVGLPVTLSASVQSYGGVPTGSVNFFDGAQFLGSAAVDIYGIAALNTSFVAGGAHRLTASFTGTLDPTINTLFLNSNGPGSSSISVNTSQPTASAPAVTLTAFPNPARVRNAVTLTATVTGSGTPTGFVVFTADGNVLGTSQLAGSSASLRVPFPTLGAHNVTATYGGDATFPQATSAALVENIALSVPADFTIGASPQSATIKAGQTATFNITVNPVGDLSSTVGFSCSGLPTAASCSFSPASLTPGINPVSTTLTLTTTAPSAAGVFPLRGPGLLFWVFILANSFSALLLVLSRGRRSARRVALIWAALVFALLLGSCGGGNGGTTGGGSNGTPPGTSSVTVTATSAASHTTALTITVTP